MTVAGRTPYEIGLNFPGLFFEYPEDGGADAPAGEPDLVVPDGGDAVADAPAAWSLSQEDWNQTQEFMRNAGPVLAQMWERLQADGQPAPEQDAGPQAPQYDPFDERSVAEFINWQVQQGIEEARQGLVGPLEPLLGHLAEQEGERLARGELDRIKADIGEFDQDQAVMLAQGLLANAPEGTDPSVVLRYTAEHVHGFEERIRKDEREKYEEFIRTKGGAPGAEGASGAAAHEGEEVPTGPGRYEVAIRRALARSNVVHPGG